MLAPNPSLPLTHWLKHACRLVQVSLDGHALPIRQLDGADPVKSLDLSKQSLGPFSAIVIASLIKDNATLTELRLGVNNLKDEGITAFFKGAGANALRTVGSAMVLVLYDQLKTIFEL